MDDLISREAAIARIDRCVALSGIGLEPVMAIRDVKALISVLPAVDAVPVVRCKDCIHWQEPFDSYNTGYLVAHCDMFKDGDAFHERFYCAHGERRDEDATD